MVSNNFGHHLFYIGKRLLVADYVVVVNLHILDSLICCKDERCERVNLQIEGLELAIVAAVHSSDKAVVCNE